MTEQFENDNNKIGIKIVKSNNIFKKSWNLYFFN